MHWAGQIGVLADTNADAGVHGTALVVMGLVFICIGVATVVWPGPLLALLRRVYLQIYTEERYDALVGGRGSRQERRMPQLLGWFPIVGGVIALFNV